MSGEVRVEAWKNPKLLAGELPKSRSTYAGSSFADTLIQNKGCGIYLRERPLCCLYSSDGRSTDDIGRRSTYIKLGCKSIHGLKQAFLDWGSRVRHPDEMLSETYSKIVAVEWDGGFLDGLKIHLSTNLNCIVGGKGTGKSTIIESIRFALGLTARTADAKAQHESIIKDVFKAGSKIQLLVEQHHPTPTQYLIERVFGSDPLVYQWLPSEVRRGELLNITPEDIFPGVEVYGQGEIDGLSKDPSTQVDIIRRFVDAAQLSSFQKREAELLAQLDENSRLLVQNRSGNEQAEADAQRLAACNERLTQFENLGVARKLEERKAYASENQLLQKAEKLLSESLTAVTSVLESCRQDTSFLSTDEVGSLPNEGLLDEARDHLDQFNSELEEALREVQLSASSAQRGVEQARSSWQPLFSEAEDRYQATLRELQKQGLDAADYVPTTTERDRLRTRAASADDLAQIEAKLISKRKGLVAQLAEVRRQMYRLLEVAQNVVNTQLGGVLKVTVSHQGDRGEVARRLSELRTTARNDQIRKLVQHDLFSTGRLSELLQGGGEELAKEFGITEAAARHLCGVNLETALEVATWAIPDTVEVSLNVGSAASPHFKETGKLSTGQRCTAMLMLILLHGDFPLLIDQPEDDLDNSFIYTDIVKRLREEKEKRQFLVATHNANIPVLGDAELIQVLSADQGQLKLCECVRGSIDDESIKHPVETILEGGQEAFALRKAKYGF